MICMSFLQQWGDRKRPRTWSLTLVPCDINRNFPANCGHDMEMWHQRLHYDQQLHETSAWKPICTIFDGRACKDQQQMPSSCIVICMLHKIVRLKVDRFLTWGLPSCATVDCYGILFSIFNHHLEDSKNLLHFPLKVRYCGEECARTDAQIWLLELCWVGLGQLESVIIQSLRELCMWSCKQGAHWRRHRDICTSRVKPSPKIPPLNEVGLNQHVNRNMKKSCI